MHRKVCALKKYVEDVCADHLPENSTYACKYALYDDVYIVDRFDVVNNCSCYGDGGGSNNIIRKVRKCFITQVSIVDRSGGRLYYVQPRDLTPSESDDIKSHFWEQSWFESELFGSEEEANEYIKNKG
jgi:hypothetical protein